MDSNSTTSRDLAPGCCELDQTQVDHFLNHGWLKLESCFGPADAEDVMGNIWTRLGKSPTDKSTWTEERINMPSHREFDAATFAPKAWNAICDLLGGEDRIESRTRIWKDSAIINFGTPAGSQKTIAPQDLNNWHVDGDFFVHYLNSPEQGLLIIPLFTPIRPGGGGTMICPPAIPKVAAHLFAHPEGVSPRMTPRAQNPDMVEESGLEWFCDLAGRFDSDRFVEVTGRVGDVYLLHPLMLHSASNNRLREVRIITNPPVSLKEPFRFDDDDDKERGRGQKGGLSIVERTTVKALEKEGLVAREWEMKGPRQGVVPERIRIQEAMKRTEIERLKRADDKRREGGGDDRNGKRGDVNVTEVEEEEVDEDITSTPIYVFK